jgi:polyhydroxyalkanoate synthesis repressor PhaR
MNSQHLVALEVGTFMNELKVIKRYQNRKLYDTHQSCYVTLEEISQMIKNGDDLRVIDNKSKNDITQATLTQLLYETERKFSNPVPVELLKEIIRKGDGSFSGYIRSNMKGDIARFEDASLGRPVTSELAEAITQ